MAFIFFIYHRPFVTYFVLLYQSFIMFINLYAN